VTALLGVWRITEAGDPPRPLGGNGQRLRENGVVDDVEELCRGVIDRIETTRSLSHADQEELLSHLFEQTVVLQRSYDPSRAGILFRPWLFAMLRRRAIDWARAWFGRSGQKRVVDTRLAEAGLRDAGLINGGDPRAGGAELVAPDDADPARGARALPDGWTRLQGDRREAAAA